MQEILPGIHHWTTFHLGIGARVHSYYVEPAAALIDPMVPEEGLAAFAGMVEPRHVLMTNRHHFRHSKRFREAFGCVVRASAPGMPDLEGRRVEAFGFGDEVAPGITAIEIGVLCPDETALHIADGGGAVAFADGLIRSGGALGFVSDPLLGDDPPAIKRGLMEAFRRLLPLDFDALLFAHGEPQASGGRAALRAFVDEPTR
jgi:hypothetical protein